MIWTLFTWLYLVSALVLALYTLGQVVLLVQYWRHRHHPPHEPALQDWPPVTIQLPIYNERHVVTRLLDAVAALDYPRDRLTVQVLDDSTDDTTALIAAHVRHLRRDGLNVRHLRRTDRRGYKAGALAYGLARTTNEIVAVFDADFVPPVDFLRRTVPHMAANPDVGIVQTRWGHLNPDDSALTLAQTLSIDAHFLIEQTGRNRSGWTLSFNGTGGLWRRACIETAGGWSDDTLTEDLDLSYRAQLQGWRYVMLPEVTVPGEVPPQLAAYKQQQSRWAKGSTQCLTRLARPVWSSKRLSLVQKMMATQNLCQYLPHPLMLILLLLTPPLLVAGVLGTLPLAPLGVVGLAPPLMYLVSQRTLYPDWCRRLLALPVLMLLGAAMTLNNTLAVLRALLGRAGGFRRTPKFARDWSGSRYALRPDVTLIGEIVLGLYALAGLVVALAELPAVAPYLGLYAAAFAWSVGQSLHETWQIEHHRQSDTLRLDWQAAEDPAREEHLTPL